MTLTLNELIIKAAEKAGSLGKLAEGMGKHQNRITEWKKGDAKPDANAIAYMAEAAGLPVFQTVAEIESQLDSRYANIWRNALGKLTAAGVAASVTGVLLISPAKPAEASTLPRVTAGPMYIMSTKRSAENGRYRMKVAILTPTACADTSNNRCR